jgi:UDP-glucose 4-epimerase
VRDYIHVEDLADAHCRALEYLQNGGASSVFNLGTGVGTTVSEIADAVEKIAGRSFARVVGPRRVGDPPALVAGAEKAASVLGWAPTRSSMEQIIASAWRWHAQGG